MSNKIFMRYLGLIFIKAILRIIAFVFSWCMHIQNSNTTPSISKYYYGVLSLINSTVLTADMIPLYKKILSLRGD